MKSSVGLFAGSLVLNAVLLGVFVGRHADATATAVEKTSANTAPAATDHAPDAARRDPQEARPATVKLAVATTSLWAALDSPDLPTLIARLRAAGFPPNIVGEIVSARIAALFAGRMKEIAGASANQPYWKSERLGVGFNSQYYEAMNQLYRERSKMLREALADPFFADPPLGALELERRRQFGNLPKDKATVVQRIADDYTEMTAKVRAATGGIILPEDREQLALLEREKRADLATILTPQELAEYEMRTSPVTSRLRATLTLMDATEEEFRAIYAVQQPYGESLYPGSGVMVQGARRLELEAQIAVQLKAVLGEQRYADYARSNDREFQQLNQIAQRENVSREAAVQAYNLRDPVTRESNRIFDDPGLTLEQKRTALLALAQTTKTQLRNTLGPAAGDAYFQAANWVNGLEVGRVTKFGAGGIIGMRGLPPAGKPSP